MSKDLHKYGKDALEMLLEHAKDLDIPEDVEVYSKELERRGLLQPA
jgi:hypothetical protein